MPEIFEVLGKGALDSDAVTPPPPQVFNDAGYDLIEAFTENVMERGGFIVDTINHSITVPKDGRYEWTASVNCEFASAEELRLSFFINGAQVGRTINLQGQGAGKPVSLTSSGTLFLPAGSVVDIRGINGDNGTVSVQFIKTYFQIKSDS